MARPPARTRQTENALGLLRGLSRETNEAIGNINAAVEKLSTNSTDKLFAIAGAGIAGTISFGAHAIWATPLPDSMLTWAALALFLSPVGFMIGRGREYIRAEKLLRTNSMIMRAQLNNIEIIKETSPELYKITLQNNANMFVKMQENLLERVIQERAIGQPKAPDNKLIAQAKPRDPADPA